MSMDLFPGGFAQQNCNGRIEVIFGPMFSGKTTELMRRIRRHSHANKKCLLIKYRKDTRYTEEEDLAATHDRMTFKAKPAMTLWEVMDACMSAEVVGVDEGQFFPDLVEVCERLAANGKTVLVAALDGTFQRKAFGRVLELVPLAETVTKLKAVCMMCYGDASFTRRLGQETAIEVIGGAEKYVAVCRECFSKPHATEAAQSANSKRPKVSETNVVPPSFAKEVMVHEAISVSS